MGIVFYCLALQEQSQTTEHIFQLIYSLISLRTQNQEIPVYLLLTGPSSPLMERFLTQRFQVRIIHCASISDILASLWPGAGQALGDYPILHKFLSLALLHDLNPSQALYVDSDTFFFADPAELLAECRTADIYAREEPCSFGSPQGYRPDHLDEARYRQLVDSENGRYVRPFNTGVMVLNHAVWERYRQLLPRFVEYNLRFTQALGTATPGVSPLPPVTYPASDLWIRDQIAFWLVLGQLETFELQILDQAQLLIGCEEMRAPGTFQRPILSHYFTINTTGFFECLPNNPYRED